jgi:glycosyltransferase involved in cell wall biosynthesis
MSKLPLRVVMVAPFSVYPKGTVPIRMLPIAVNMVKRGYEVSIVVPPYDNQSESGKEYLLQGVCIFNIKFRNVPVFKYSLTLFSLSRKIISLHPQCVYIFKPKAYSGLVAILFAFLKRLGLLRNVRIVVDADDWEGHGGFSDYFKKQLAYPKAMLDFFDFQENWIPKHVDAMTVASRALEIRALEQGVPRQNLYYVPNGAPQRDFQVNASEVTILRQRLNLLNAPAILLYTRFFEYRLEKIIEILKYVKRDFPTAKLIVVGKGEFHEEKKLHELALKAALQDSVIFAGWIGSKDIPKYLALADVAIYPFDNTALNSAKCPGKLVELMAAGQAIVADRVGQIAEYIQDRQSGILVDPNNYTEFARSVIEILRNASLQKQLRASSQFRISSDFNWAKLVDDVEHAICPPKRS